MGKMKKRIKKGKIIMAAATLVAAVPSPRLAKASIRTNRSADHRASSKVHPCPMTTGVVITKTVNIRVTEPNIRE